MFDKRPGVIETLKKEGDKLVLNETYDATTVVRQAHILADDPPKGSWWRHAAYIPQHVFNQAVREGWLHDRQAWKRWANDSDNGSFRTWRGRL